MNIYICNYVKKMATFFSSLKAQGPSWPSSAVGVDLQNLNSHPRVHGTPCTSGPSGRASSGSTLVEVLPLIQKYRSGPVALTCRAVRNLIALCTPWPIGKPMGTANMTYTYRPGANLKSAPVAEARPT